MSLSRRHFLAGSAATSLAFMGLNARAAVRPADPKTDPGYKNEVEGYGRLKADPAGLIELPEGFTYRIFSRMGETMDDGLLVPGKHDGMAAFAHSDPDKVILVRNHELNHKTRNQFPVGGQGQNMDKLDRSKVYDFTADDDFPLGGGTSTLIYNIKTQALESHYLSLTGTSTNCAGGLTPWGSWLTCEESNIRAGEGVKKDHGWVFEVPSKYKGLVDPVPLKAMGRFEHEAACVDPRTGIVYLTEDRPNSLFYRFIPAHKGQLHHGGKLQALVIRDALKAETGNQTSTLWKMGDRFATSWIDLKNVESPDDTLREEGFALGAARFVRGEGIHWGNGELFFACTAGGPHGFGQIMRYTPSAHEGTSDEAKHPGIIDLFVESGDQTVLDYADNLTVAPWGHLFVCEDRYSDVLINHLRIVTPQGKVATFARNVNPQNSEWAGVCFSPDGSTLFANLQANGMTVAITGPWNGFKDTAVQA